MSRDVFREPYEQVAETYARDHAGHWLLKESTRLERVAITAALVEDAQRALRMHIRVARAAGDTWAEIGAVLGMSRQAAQQRFGEP